MANNNDFDYLLKNKDGLWESYIRGDVELDSGEVKILAKNEPWVVFLKDSLCEDFDIIESNYIKNYFYPFFLSCLFLYSCQPCT